LVQLSVNINKVATIRNARGGDLPDVVKFGVNCERYGAEGITVHPRPDERHIRYRDVMELSRAIQVEFNIEGYPSEEFIDLVMEAGPAQVTLVPDPPDVITSNAGWDTIKHKGLLQGVIEQLKKAGIRTSIFLDPNPELVKHASETGTDRIELYTESYAAMYRNDPESAVADYIRTAEEALKHSLGINAGHDLNLDNLEYFAHNVPGLLEVSIGHALISDALYYGIENTIQMYRRCLRR
jgi:pyridoxine 5-phosphate synthase